MARRDPVIEACKGESAAREELIHGKGQLCTFQVEQPVKLSARALLGDI